MNNVVKFPQMREEHEPGCLIIKCVCNELLAWRASIAREREERKLRMKLTSPEV